MSVNVQSIERIEALVVGLERFAVRAEAALDAAEAELRRVAAELEDRVRHGEAEVAHWRDEIDDVDDDEEDIEGLEMQLGEAEASLDRVRALQSDLEAQFASYRSEVAHLRRLANEGLPGASKELGRLVDALRGIRSVLLPGMQIEPAGGGLPTPSSLTPSPIVKREAYSGAGQALPRGFVWVPLSEIRSRELRELPTPQEFSKVSYDDVVRGFETLQRNVFPAIQPTGDGDIGLESAGTSPGADPPADAHHVFQAFFGGDRIHLSRKVGDKYDIINGRHRIRVAFDLGWTAIPASADEVE